MNELSSAQVREVGAVVRQSKTLLSAGELGQFTALGAAIMTGAQSQHTLGLHPPQSPDFLMGSLHMLVELGDAFNVTAADLFGRCHEVGFPRTEVLALAGVTSAGIAYK